MSMLPKRAAISCLMILSTSLLFTCAKEPNEAVTPDEVELGKSTVFLNGVSANYLPMFNSDTFSQQMFLRFSEDLTATRGFINTFVFGSFPIKISNFELKEGSKKGDWVLTGFGQRIDIDGLGYTYELDDDDKNFLKIQSIDTIKMEIAGQFRVKYCRTSKNGNKDLGLPKILLFQGTFNENFAPF